MKVEDVMTRRVVAARADTELSHVARLMWDNDCGSVLGGGYICELDLATLK